MAIQPVGTYNSPTNERITAKTLSQQDFMKLLITQLQNQDPMKPQDAGAMLQQMSSIGMIQSMTSMQESLSQTRTDQQLTLGQSLINKTVRMTDANGVTVSGPVTEVRLSDGKVQLQVSGQYYDISNLQAVL